MEQDNHDKDSGVAECKRRVEVEELTEASTQMGDDVWHLRCDRTTTRGPTEQTGAGRRGRQVGHDVRRCISAAVRRRNPSEDVSDFGSS